MATQRQILANRLNSQKSTGPRTEEGKARSCLNALRTGIDSNSLRLPGEDPAAIEQLRAEYYAFHEPVTPEERDTLDAIVFAVCLLRRLRALDAQVASHAMTTIENLDQSAPLGHAFSLNHKTFAHLQARMNAAERSFHRNLDLLQQLQSQRPPEEPETAAEPPAGAADPPPQTTESESQTSELASNLNSCPEPSHPVPNPAPLQQPLQKNRKRMQLIRVIRCGVPGEA